MNGNSLSKPQSLDIYRKTCLRYLGYFGLLGRVCAPIVPGNIVKTIALGYIISDVADKSATTIKEQASNFKLFVTATDAVIWQTVASLLIPTIFVKSLTEYAQKFKILGKFAKIRSGTLPYVLGVSLLPILSENIDSGVNFAMDKTYRKLFEGNSEINEHTLEPNALILSETPELKVEKLEHGNIEQIYEEFKSRNPASKTGKTTIPERTSKKNKQREKKRQSLQQPRQS